MPTVLSKAATIPTYIVEQNETSDGRLVWQVIKEGAKRFCHSGPNHKETVDVAKALAQKNKGKLIVRTATGGIRSQADYSRSKPRA